MLQFSVQLTMTLNSKCPQDSGLISPTDNNYGVSIWEDCKYGSDKPDNSTLYSHYLLCLYFPYTHVLYTFG